MEGEIRMRIQLHKWEGNTSGWSAWSLAHLGFATWRPTREGVLERVPGKFDTYTAWLRQHGQEVEEDDASNLEVVEEIAGDEVAFREDFLPAEDAEIARCEILLACSRRSLIETVSPLSDEALDRDPPYERFDEWAWWRTVRQIVAHIALCEVGYYLPSIGWRVPLDPEDLRDAPWREQLIRSREETLRFLEAMRTSKDRVRLTQGQEAWSLRKVLRRLVWHERVHWKSITRILRDWEGTRRPEL